MRNSSRRFGEREKKRKVIFLPDCVDVVVAVGLARGLALHLKKKKKVIITILCTVCCCSLCPLRRAQRSPTPPQCCQIGRQKFPLIHLCEAEATGCLRSEEFP